MGGELLTLRSLFLEKRDSIPTSILALVTARGREDGNINPAIRVARLLLDQESNVNNQKLMGKSNVSRLMEA